jgi:hypothetical protein
MHTHWPTARASRHTSAWKGERDSLKIDNLPASLLIPIRHLLLHLLVLCTQYIYSIIIAKGEYYTYMCVCVCVCAISSLQPTACSHTCAPLAQRFLSQQFCDGGRRPPEMLDVRLRARAAYKMKMIVRKLRLLCPVSATFDLNS